MAIVAPTLWLPPGVRDHVDANGAVKSHAFHIPLDAPGSLPKSLVDAYIHKLRSNGYLLEALEEVPNLPLDELQRVMKSELVKSGMREGYSLSTAVGLANVLSHIPTQSVHSMFATMLQSNSQMIERAIKLRGGRLPGPVYVNEYPSHGFNAFVEPHGSGYVVYVHRGLMIALHLAARIYSWNWGFTHFDDVAVRRSELPWTGERTILALAKLAGEIIQRNVTSAPRHRIPSGIRFWLYTSMLEAAELFVLAHEYAHILNEDLTVWEERGVAAAENAADLVAWNLLFTDVDRSGRTPGGRDDAKAIIAGVVLLFGLRHLILQVRERVFEKRPVYVVSELERSKRFRQYLERDDDWELLDHFDSCFGWWTSATQCVLENCTWSRSNPTPFTGDPIL